MVVGLIEDDGEKRESESERDNELTGQLTVAITSFLQR